MTPDCKLASIGQQGREVELAEELRSYKRAAEAITVYFKDMMV